jgi:multidrug efflux pump
MVLVTGMVVGTMFTLIVVPVFYSLLASKHRSADESEDVSQSPALPSPNPTAA